MYFQAWCERMRTRPVLTGAYHKPSMFNGPLPRLRPQPLHITGMIVWRRKARERRLARQEVLQEQAKLLEAESKFELMLAKKSGSTPFDQNVANNLNKWREFRNATISISAHGV